VLEEVYQECLRADSLFEHKAVLAIPSESYDAPVITVAQGLDELGFTVYTFEKDNINTWFCNEVVDDVPEVDFVLWSLHWGTRWGLYEKLGLDRFVNVLIDGDDQGWLTWRQKHKMHTDRYREKPKRSMVLQGLQPYRWMEPLGDFEPDVIFTSQHGGVVEQGCYLPFGMHREYFKHCEWKTWRERQYDFAAVKGPGPKRQQLFEWLRINDLPGKVFNGEARGPWSCDPSIRPRIKNDPNVHSWHRWREFEDYWELLNDSRFLIYPGVRSRPQWDAQRPWEAMAAGALLMIEEPSVYVGPYPVTDVAHVYPKLPIRVGDYDPDGGYEKARKHWAEQARRYFCPEAVARYFLKRIYDHAILSP